MPAEHWAVPAEVLEEHAGASISWDDVLDFTLALEDTDVLAAIAGAVPTTRHLA